MATKYASSYGVNPSNPADYIYRGPSVKTTGEMCIRQMTFKGILAAADILKLCPLRKGEKLIGFYNNRDGDPDAANDATVNIGTTSAPTLLASASTGMQAQVKLQFDAGDLILKAAAAAGDDLQLVLAAGVMEVEVTHHFTIISHLPQP